MRSESLDVTTYSNSLLNAATAEPGMLGLCLTSLSSLPSGMRSCHATQSTMLRGCERPGNTQRLSPLPKSMSSVPRSRTGRTGPVGPETGWPARTTRRGHARHFSPYRRGARTPLPGCGSHRNATDRVHRRYDRLPSRPGSLATGSSENRSGATSHCVALLRPTRNPSTTQSRVGQFARRPDLLDSPRNSIDT